MKKMQTSYNLLLIENFFTKAMKEEIENKKSQELSGLFVSALFPFSTENNECYLAHCTAAKQGRKMRTFHECWEEVPKPKSFIPCSMAAIHTHSLRLGSPMQGISLVAICFSLCTSGSRNICCLLLWARNWHLFLYFQHLAQCQAQCTFSTCD